MLNNIFGSGDPGRPQMLQSNRNLPPTTLSQRVKNPGFIYKVSNTIYQLAEYFWFPQNLIYSDFSKKNLVLTYKSSFESDYSAFKAAKIITS